MDDTFTLSLSSDSSILEAQYYPPIELKSEKNYVLGLVELLTFNSIPNIDINSNKFYVGKEVIAIPVGSYEIEDLEKYLCERLTDLNIDFKLKPNNNTLQSSIKCSHPIDFNPDDSIGPLLGLVNIKSNIILVKVVGII